MHPHVKVDLDFACSLQSHELQPARLLCPWDSSGKNTGVDCHALLLGISLTRGLNLCLLLLLHWQAGFVGFFCFFFLFVFLPLAPPVKPCIILWDGNQGSPHHRHSTKIGLNAAKRFVSKDKNWGRGNDTVLDLRKRNRHFKEERMHASRLLVFHICKVGPQAKLHCIRNISKEGKGVPLLTECIQICV